MKFPVLCACFAWFCAQPAFAADVTLTLTVDDRERSCIVHLPSGYEDDKRHPLVLAFHGGGSNAASMVRFSGLNATADRESFIVAYPDGTGRLQRLLTFNGGNCCGYALAQQVDDVAFVRALLDRIEADYAMDPRRVYATGMSNGGIISYRLAAELADRIAAIAPVAGTMGIRHPSPSRPVPVMHFHGTDDRFLSYGGGFGSKSVSKTLFISVDETIAAWVAIDRCAPDPKIETLPDRTQDGCTVTRHTWSGGKAGAEVVLVRIENGGHTWPGGTRSPDFLGTVCTDISANDLMWEFFKKHSLP